MRTWKKPAPAVLAALLCLLTISAPSTYAAEGDAPSSPTLAAIDGAYSRGEISEAEAVLYKLSFVKGALLPKAFDLGGERIKCGTPIILEAFEKAGGFAEPYQSQIKAMLSRPSLSSYLDTAHFRIHYSTSGANIIYNWPDTAYRDSVAAACEKCYNFDHVLNGWQVPPSDGSTGGGSGLIDIYVDDVGSGVYGFTTPESSVPGGYPYDYTGYVTIDHAYDGFGYTDRALPMKVTVAHEYHHLVQFGYNASQNSWWMENTATFMEDETYDDINDNYNYLSSYMTVPYLKQSTFNSGYEYGCFVWPTFLKEKWSHSLVRDIWACTATTAAFTCFNNLLAAATPVSTHADALKEWILWNFYTGVRTYGSHYIEAVNYGYAAPLSYDRYFTSYPQTSQHPTTAHKPEATGAGIQRFKRDTSSTDNVMTITFDGPNCTSQVVMVCKLAGQVVFQEHYMTLDATGNGTLEIHDWDTMEYAYLFASMSPGCGSSTYDYIFSAVTSQATGANEHPPLYVRTVDLEQNLPNPFARDTRIAFSTSQEGPVDLSIFDASGRLVRSLVRSSQPQGDHAVSWDSRDDAGKPVVPGVYFYRLDAAGTSCTKKMILVP
jgi:hypothetical protein